MVLRSKMMIMTQEAELSCINDTVVYIRDLGEEKIFVLNVYDNGETELIINKDKIYKEE